MKKFKIGQSVRVKYDHSYYGKIQGFQKDGKREFAILYQNGQHYFPEVSTLEFASKCPICGYYDFDGLECSACGYRR